jgi:hypothetical protein
MWSILWLSYKFSEKLFFKKKQFSEKLNDANCTCSLGMSHDRTGDDSQPNGSRSGKSDGIQETVRLGMGL